VEEDSADKPSRAGPFSRIDTLPEAFLKQLRHLPQPGDLIGERYKLVESLGRGAMGQVFVAENLAINRQVAVKVLHPFLLADPEFRARFQQEAEAVASIDHPSVARFFDLVVGDPTFLVMEFVPGDTLSTELKREQRLPQERALAIAERLCWALDAAHAAGVVHRDLKPSNVILARDRAGNENPKLIDFGLAKRPDSQSLTRQGQIIGTPAYMAPEQIAGTAVDARSDVYALGCVLYEMLCGRPPFALADDMQLLYQHVHDEPDPPSKHAQVGPELDEVLRRTLEKDPAKRFQTMADLARTLVSRQRRRSEDVQRPAQKSQVPAWAAIVAALASAVVAAGAVRLTRRAPAATSGARILVISRPAGAAAVVDGRTLPESTPTVASGLATGDHVVQILRPGLNPVEQRLKLAANERAVVEITLPPRTRTVQVSSSPSGARVYLDGKLQPVETPLPLVITDDEFHELRFEKAGYELTNARLTPEDNRGTLEVELPGETRPRGTVSVDANGTADVFIDGEASGFTTPTLGFRLPVGTHSFELHDASGKAGPAQKVQVKQGENLHLMLELPTRRSP
jgi:serine/threonine-protein kinase